MANQPSKNPKYKLYYFNIRGLGEPIRFLFAYGGIEYEDIRVPREEWPSLKPTMPMGQMPVLEVDGQRVHQSTSIARYLAKRVGLAGANDWENLQIDIAVDTINDLRLKLVVVHFEQDAEVKEQKFADLKKDTIPFYLEKLDSIAKENNGYFALGRLTWADVFFTSLFELFKFTARFDIAEKYENIMRVVANVSSLPAIKEWIEKRPQTDF